MKEPHSFDVICSVTFMPKAAGTAMRREEREQLQHQTCLTGFPLGSSDSIAHGRWLSKTTVDVRIFLLHAQPTLFARFWIR